MSVYDKSYAHLKSIVALANNYSEHKDPASWYNKEHPRGKGDYEATLSSVHALADRHHVALDPLPTPKSARVDLLCPVQRTLGLKTSRSRVYCCPRNVDYPKKYHGWLQYHRYFEPPQHQACHSKPASPNSVMGISSLRDARPKTSSVLKADSVRAGRTSRSNSHVSSRGMTGSMSSGSLPSTLSPSNRSKSERFSSSSISSSSLSSSGGTRSGSRSTGCKTKQFEAYGKADKLEEERYKTALLVKQYRRDHHERQRQFIRRPNFHVPYLMYTKDGAYFVK